MRIWQSSNLPNLYLLALPVVAVGWGWGVGTTVAALGVGLGWKWFTRLHETARAKPRERREIVLETIAASHYVEKARWCLDRLGVEYRERPAVGVLGVILTGRSVPRLRLGRGPGATVLGDSSDILRYLWAQYGSQEPDRAAFLEPSREAVDLEQQIDRYGYHVRRWLYHGSLPDRAFTLQIWGRHDARLPRWQRWLIDAAYPLIVRFLRRALAIGDEETRHSVTRVEAFLDDIEARLGDGRSALLGGDRSYVDYAFAAQSCLWLTCSEYGGGAAQGYMPPPDRWPPELRRDMADWRSRYPRIVSFVEGLYASERHRRREQTPD